MNPVMQNVPYLKHVALERRPICTVPSSENKCPFPGRYGFRFQLQVDQTLKDSWISHSMMAVQRNASLKHERNLEENFQNIIFAGNKANRMKKHTQKKKLTKNRRIKKLICVREVTYDHALWTLVYFAPDVLEGSIVTIFRWRRKQFRTCSKLSANQ